MSKYTTEVRFICESVTGLDSSADYDDIDTVIAAAVPLIFSFDFPIFDNTYRSVLCSKILRHYYTREIGVETYGLWKLKLQTRLNEIMPYYNKLYESELYAYNPLYDVDLITTNSGSKTGENTNIGKSDNTTERNAENSTVQVGSNIDSRVNKSVGSSVVDSKSENSDVSSGTTTNDLTDRDLYSDTPQGALTGVDNETYLTNARKVLKNGTVQDDNTKIGQGRSEQNINDVNTESSDGSNSSVNNTTQQNKGTDSSSVSSTMFGSTRNTEDYVMHVIGKSAGSNYAKNIRDFRDNLLNIDMDVINDLSDLFMLIW